MSKLDAQRAMREAKYARDRASGPSRREAAAVGGIPVTQAAHTPSNRAAQADATAPTAAAPEGERCGHKSMNGRACTRDAAHCERSHRYG
jgi:hypothetical protein